MGACRAAALIIFSYRLYGSHTIFASSRLRANHYGNGTDLLDVTHRDDDPTPDWHRR
jgi:hypothetical protein